MDIAEIHASILLKIDKVGSYSTGNLNPGEIDDFINDAIDEFIDRQRQAIRSYRYSEAGIEAQENLRTVIERSSTTSNITSSTLLGTDCWEVPLSEFPDLDYFVSGTITANGDTSIMRYVSSSFITDSERGAHLNFFDRGIPISVEASRIIGFIPRDRTIVPSEVSVAYLNYPNEVNLDPNNSANNVDPNLPEHTHREIVDIAATKIISSLSGQEPQNRSQGDK